MATRSSLFDAPASPVLPTAAEWLTGTLFGGLATGLCVIAVAFVGFRLMMGHMAIRDGLRVVIGCFVLLGAPLIALGLQRVALQPEAPVVTAAAVPVLPEVPTPPYDPYLGATVNPEGFQAPPERPDGAAQPD